MSPHVIVCLAHSTCDEYPDMTCVLMVEGPFESREEARPLFNQRKEEGWRPHWISLDAPEPVYQNETKAVTEQ